MPVSYNQTVSTDMIIAETEALFQWHGNILRLCFFPDVKPVPSGAMHESKVLSWCSQQVVEGAIDRRLVDRLSHSHALLMRAAQSLIEQAQDGKPSTDALQALEQQFSSYLTQVQRLQHEYGPAAASMDMGLRNSAELKNDIKREQDRFNRKGTSFSIAAIEIDNLVEIHNKYSLEDQKIIFSHVGALMGQAIRSFDDAYYMGNGSYTMVLKHIEFLDACSVMDRLRLQVEKTSVALGNGEKVSVTASFGVAEAMPNESFEYTIDHAQSALKQAKQQGGNRVAEHEEMSTLERFVKDKDV